MKAIIPVAGAGTRLRPHTFIVPKVLLNVGGKPIISHIIEQAQRFGINEFAFITGYKGNQIKEFIESNYSIKYSFYEQRQMLGLAYAVSLADDFLTDEPVFIILGDTIFEVDLKPVFKGKHSSLGVKTVDDPSRFGIVCLDDKGYIKQLIEKPSTTENKTALVGLYFLKQGVLLKEAVMELMRRQLKTKDEYQITDALQIMIDRGHKMTTFEVEGWYDCGKPETILLTNQYLLSKQHQIYDIQGSLVRYPAYIDSTAVVENSVIGPYTTIAKGSTINNSIVVNTIVGEESTVCDANIKNSLISNSAHVSGTLTKINISDFSEISI